MKRGSEKKVTGYSKKFALYISVAGNTKNRQQY